MTSNILQYLEITNLTYPLRTATAEASWGNSLSLLVLSAFHLVQAIYYSEFHAHAVTFKNYLPDDCVSMKLKVVHN